MMKQISATFYSIRKNGVPYACCFEDDVPRNSVTWTGRSPRLDDDEKEANFEFNSFRGSFWEHSLPVHPEKIYGLVSIDESGIIKAIKIDSRQ